MTSWLSRVASALTPKSPAPQTAIVAPGGVAAGAVHGGIFNFYGLTAEQLFTELERRGFDLRAAENAGVQRRLIINLAQRLRQDEHLSLDQAFIEIESAVDIARDLIASGTRAHNDDAFVHQVLAQVANRVRDNDLDGGARALDAALADLEARNRRSKVTLLEEAVKVDTLRRDAPAVARRIERIVLAETPTDRPAWLPAFRQQRDRFYEEGRDKGINFSLAVAIELSRRMLETAQNADEAGAARTNLGNALATLGERESDTQRLEEAVTAYRAALTEYTQDRVPLAWATTQNNLGLALSTLGARESGTQRLEEAVTAYRAALTEVTQDRVPLDWATTQNNLGTALLSLGERESGTQRLEEAVTAYRAALTEVTQDRVPLDWAMTQHNLGTALQTLGARESGTQRLEAAVTAYRAALTERRQDRVPLDWAMTQNNLGIALQSLGERESGTQRLEEAVTAYRAALTEWTQDRVPLNWATTQNNLGNALATLGARESGTQRLEAAVTAYRAALTERRQDRVPLDWAMTQNNLGTALQSLGERESGTQRLEEAVTAFRAALTEYTQDRVPLNWARTQNNLGTALATLGARESGTQRLEAAVAAFEACLSVTEAVWPAAWVQGVRSDRDAALAEIKRRTSR